MKQIGVRFKIFILLAILLLTGMLLLDITVMLFAERHLLQSEKEKGRMLAAMLANTLGDHPEETALSPSQRAILAESHATAVVAADMSGHRFLLGEKDDAASLVAQEARQALAGKDASGFDGETWSVFGRQKKTWWVSRSYQDVNGASHALALSIQLTPIYSRLRATQEILAWYLVVNTLLLSLVGLYRIHRLAIQPLSRIILQAEAFRSGDGAFLLDEGEHDMRRLSLALNRVLELNREDQEKLRNTVSCLEAALADLKAAHQEIIRTEKLATVGRMASGIAHEIGNPIGIVLGYLELIKQPDIPGPEKEDYISRAEGEIGRIRAIIKQLLDYARPMDEISMQVSLHDLLSDLIDMARVQPTFAGMTVTPLFCAGDDRVLGDPGRLKQLFLNLMLNAADAIQGGGELAIRSETVSSSFPQVCISFEDTGPGIPQEALARIFEPFYSTKPSGMGTGLGLWVSLTIVEAMGGTLRAASEEGKGTTMTVCLPTAGVSHG